jgi:choice-of-anchor B domain-containing protein
MRQVGFLPCPAPTDPNALWKEVRGYKSYMLIGSELRGHGVQIFDMRKLLEVAPENMPVRYDAVADLAGRFMDLPTGQAHNVVINEESNFAVAVGARPLSGPCRSGLIMFDLEDLSTTKTLGCNGDDGYVHDAQCVVYRGPDEQYVGRDICYGFNEDTLTIYDVTDKANSTIVSITSYEGAAYTHQGWLLDPNWQQFLLMDDEYDEFDQTAPAADQYPVTYIWDISSLAAPKQTGLYKGTVVSVDHNQYIKDGRVYQSNYNAGLRVYDVSSIPEDPTGDSVCEIAYFDVRPEDDSLPGGGEATFFGTWSSYAMFDSGFIFINTIERGAFLVKMTNRNLRCPKTHPCNSDNCLRAMRASSIEGRLEESQEFCADFTDGWSADVGVVPAYASKACGTNVIARVSSACSCLPTPTPTA